MMSGEQEEREIEARRQMANITTSETIRPLSSLIQVISLQTEKDTQKKKILSPISGNDEDREIRKTKTAKKILRIITRRVYRSEDALSERGN